MDARRLSTLFLATSLVWTSPLEAANPPSPVPSLDIPPSIVTAEPPPLPNTSPAPLLPPPPPIPATIAQTPSPAPSVEVTPSPEPSASQTQAAASPLPIPSASETAAASPPPAPSSLPSAMAEPAPSLSPPAIAAEPEASPIPSLALPEVSPIPEAAAPAESPTPLVEATPTPTESVIPEVLPATPAPEATQAEAPQAAPTQTAVDTRAALRGGYALDYLSKRPSWAAQASFSPNALGNADLSGGQGVTPEGVTLNFEYQPQFLQALGVFAFGPTLSFYPVLPENPDVQNTPYSVWSFGAQFRYEARYFREQMIVPMIGYDYERLTYALTVPGNGSMTLSGAVGGVYILLNSLEPSAAYDFYEDSGILRTYLTLELHALSGSSSSLAVSGHSFYFGIRTEF